MEKQKKGNKSGFQRDDYEQVNKPFDLTKLPETFAEQLRRELPNQPIEFFSIFGMIETVTVIPSGIPKKLYDQMKFYTDSLTAPTVFRFYIYSTKLKAWHYSALT